MIRRSNTLQSAKYLHKKRKKKITLTLVYFACSIALLGIIVLVLRADFFQISKLEVLGTATLNAEEMAEVGLNSLSGHFFYVIPKSNILFYSSQSIRDYLLEKYKKIDTLDIKRKAFSTLGIYIMEKSATALVCDGFHDDGEAENTCYFVDKDGYIYEKAPDFSYGVYTHYYISNNDAKNIIGTKFIDSKTFGDLQNFVKSIKDAGIPIVGLLVGEKGSYELYLKNKDGSEAVVYFDDRIPFEKTSSNLIVFWDNKTIFDYINLRFGNNIFYVTK